MFYIGILLFLFGPLARTHSKKSIGVKEKNIQKL